MAHVRWVTESRDFSTGELRAVLPAYNRQGEWKLSDIGELRFDLPLYHKSVTPSNIEALRDEIWLWRYIDDVPKLVFAGPLMTVYVNNSQQKLTCTANSLEAHLNMRVVEPYYSVTVPGVPVGVKFVGDPEDVAWFLIDQAQRRLRGNMRLIRGVKGGGGPDIEYTYQTSDYKGVLETIQEDLIKTYPVVTGMAGSVAFDFDIDPTTRAWNSYYPFKGRDLSNVVTLQYGGNVKTYWNQIYGSPTATWVGMRGAGDPPDFFKYENIMASERYGLRQKVLSWKDSPARDQLEQVTRHNVSVLAAPKQVVGMTMRGHEFDFWGTEGTPAYNSAGLGDIVRVKIDDGFTQVNKPQRIVGWQLTIGSEDNETYNVYTNDLREVMGDANAAG